MGILRGSRHIIQDSRFLVENNLNWKQPFFFIQGADTQLGLIFNWGTDGNDGTQYPESNWDREIELCRQSVEVMNRMRPKPAFSVVCGDLVDAFPDQHPDIRALQVADLKKVYDNLDPEIPMVCVCGNCDVGNRPTHKTIRQYQDSFGDDYFYFSFLGVFFIVLNSQLYEDHTHVPDLYKAHEDWLKKVLDLPARKQAKHTIIFQHIPWFINDPEEEKEYFNLEPSLRQEKLEMLHAAGIRKIFCGHCHRNAGGFYKDLEVVITSAIGCQLGPHQHGMRIVKVTENSVEHEYFPLQCFPVSVQLMEGVGQGK